MAGIYKTIRTAVRNVSYDLLKDYFPDRTLANAPIIFSHVNGAEPSETYLVINILNMVQQGRSDTSTLTSEDIKLTNQSMYELLVQFSFIGKDSGDMAHSMHSRISGNWVALESFSLNNLGYMRKTQIRRIPEKRETQWIEKNNFDCTFSYIVNSQDTVEYVEAVVIEQILKDREEDDTFTVPKNILVP